MRRELKNFLNGVAHFRDFWGKKNLAIIIIFLFIFFLFFWGGGLGFEVLKNGKICGKNNCYRKTAFILR